MIRLHVKRHSRAKRTDVKECYLITRTSLSSTSLFLLSHPKNNTSIEIKLSGFQHSEDSRTMVQFRSKGDTKGSGYWKLSSSPGIARKMHAELANFGTTYPAKTPKRRLRKIHERSQRGLLVYEVCGVGDLRRFCTARHIQVGPEMDKDKLIEKLEYADDQAVFRYVTKICVAEAVIAFASII